MKNSDGVLTQDGLIPHLYVDSLGIWLTVRLRSQLVTSIRGVRHQQLVEGRSHRPIPERMSDGRLIYALPGGGDYESEQK